ncbi:hypothetical protein A0O28_0095230 [Trichoderma guizhouense]|uniref:Uncharacterized protein n=1 Tax=Trichoderma guizhouense TaxID=1491466 RepID=A0A1T3CEZ6_9HYPO|nr:hypothetical protein A0O28_0095230 [Trichoderma guizhouense]
MPPEQQTGYQGPGSADFFNVTPKQEREYCKALVGKVFQLAGVERGDRDNCYNACVDKCVKTGLLRAHVWEEWGGYPELGQRMARIAERTNQTGEYHILDAETAGSATRLLLCSSLYHYFHLL